MVDTTKTLIKILPKRKYRYWGVLPVERSEHKIPTNKTTLEIGAELLWENFILP